MEREVFTFNDFVNNNSGIFLIDIIDDNVGAKFCIHVGVGTSNAGTSTSNDHSLPIEPYGGR